MKNLKLFKIVEKIQLDVAYLAGIFLISGFFSFLVNENNTSVSRGLVIASIVFFVVLVLLEIPGYIIACLSAGLSEISVAKENMKIKFIYIPFFILNFFSCLAALLYSDKIGFIIAPLLVLFIAFCDFLVMFETSLCNIIYFVKKYISKKLKPTAWSIIAIIMSFLFCLDVISGIILYRHEINQIPEIAEQIKAKKREKILKKGEKWQKRRHMSPIIFAILSIIGSIVLFISTAMLLVPSLGVFTEEWLLSVVPMNFVTELLDNSSYLTAFTFVCVAVIYKCIIAVIYGKNGEKNPITFVCVMKIIDSIATLGLLISSAVYFIVGTALGVASAMLIVCIAVIVIFFVMIAFAAVGVAAYLYGAGLFGAAVLSIFGDPLTIFSYYMNQRIVKNRRLLNKFVVVCMVLLWIPILNIPTLFVLRSIEKKRGVLGEKPVV